MEPGKEIIQEKTGKSPGMYFDRDNKMLLIEGRSIPENPELVFRPLKNWIDRYFPEHENLNIKINLEYINSGSSKHLMSVLKILRLYQSNGKKLKIDWFYEEGDESILELGEHFSETSGLPIDIEMLTGE